MDTHILKRESNHVDKMCCIFNFFHSTADISKCENEKREYERRFDVLEDMVLVLPL
jgi:hypothetical protein